jgi:hypothetical protein
MLICKEIINFKDKLYLVHKKFKESHIKPEKINELKDLLGSTIVLKQRNGEFDYLFFLTEIPEAEIVG